jgi:hypothetical protein
MNPSGGGSDAEYEELESGQDKREEQQYGAHPGLTAIVLIAQIYISFMSLFAASKANKKIASLPDDNEGQFFTVPNIFLVIFTSTILFVVNPLFSSLWRQLDKLLVYIANVRHKQSVPIKAILPIIQDKADRMTSTVWALAFIIAYPVYGFRPSTADPSAGKGYITYDDLSLQAIGFSKIWVLFVNLALGGQLMTQLLSTIEMMRGIHKKQYTLANPMESFFGWSLYQYPRQRQHYGFVSATGDEQQAAKLKLTCQQQKPFYRHHAIFSMLWWVMIAAIVVKQFWSIIGLEFCENDADRMLYIIFNAAVNNLDKPTNTSRIMNTTSMAPCPVNSVGFYGVDLVYGLLTIGPSHMPTSDVSTFNSSFYHQLINGTGVVDHRNQSNVQIELTQIPEDVVRIYGVMLALLQEIQAYFYIAISFLVVPIGTLVLAHQQEKKKRCLGACCLRASYGSEIFVKGMDAHFHQTKNIVMIAGIVLVLVFRQEGFLPNSAYENTLWECLAYALKEWSGYLGKSLVLGDIATDAALNMSGADLDKIEGISFAWGAVWTAFLVWAPPLLLIAAVMNAYRAIKPCVTNKVEIKVEAAQSTFWATPAKEASGEVGDTKEEDKGELRVLVQ